MTLDELNGTDRGGFVSAVGSAFEDSPWVAERAWDRRPFDTLDALHDAMSSVVASAGLDEQLSLLRAHPELGARAKMSQASAVEQAGAGLAALTGDEAERFRSLNATYREKFGFPFLYAVRGRTPQDMLNALERRLTSARDAEHHEALRQVYRIARFRLEDMVS
jgi:2-oxo-4-hydroxy-4-carboxy-5-ureidoimidazoline decarboxylase